MSKSPYATNKVIPSTYMTKYDKKKRNQVIVKELKELYENKCQVCGQTIDLGNEIKYSEVHHIQPLGCDGVDDKCNMIVLCPNHHKMFDLGIIAINPMDCITLIHINTKDNLNNIKIVFKHLVSSLYIKYDYEHIHLELVKEIDKSF